MVHRIEASQVSTELLDEIAASRSPYIKIDGMTMSFTGYYKVSENGNVYSYCYIGCVGDDYILADLPATDSGALAEDNTIESSVLEDYTLKGQLVQAGDMTACLAEGEEMTPDDYKEYYHMANVEIRDYGSDQERIRIYQLMLIVAGLGAFAVGCILVSESKIAEAESTDEENC
jgi:hypothetical protein